MVERQNRIKVSSTKTEGKTPSDVLTLEELVIIAPHIPPDVLFKTISFAYWNQKFINSYGDLYLNELRELDNDSQRYILFCWFIGCHLWKWNESIFEHEIADEFYYFDETDWKRANDAIMTLATSGLG
jgi:hypothetical protein